MRQSKPVRPMRGHFIAMGSALSIPMFCLFIVFEGVCRAVQVDGNLVLVYDYLGRV